MAATDCAEAWPGGANPRPRSGAAAERSYPTTEERVGSWEVRGQGLRLGVPGCDKCIYPRPEVRGPFGERTRDCSPGQAGKEGPHLAMTGASHGFPQPAAPMGVFSRGTMRTSGSLSCGARQVRSPCAWRGGAGHHSRVMGNG